jgi:hypothetical protein
LDGRPSRPSFPDAPASQVTPLTRNPEQITYYFRTTFTVRTGAQNLLFYADVDDGAAIYVNGTEVGRANIAAGLALAFDTLTPNLYDPDAALYMPVAGLPIPASVLVPGNNVLAIEVHQNATASSDILMICKITAESTVIESDPPVIVTGPADASVSQGHQFSLSVVASGGALSYQWSKDGVDITGATTATLTTIATSGGTYKVVVSNPSGTVSDTATVTVRPVIVPYGQTWKYETASQDATLGGTAWYAPGFDDSAWASGPGPFGLETAGIQARFPAPITAPRSSRRS